MKTWSRRTIWGDRLFLRFEGPATILLQTRANRVKDIMTGEQINEVADAPAGAVGKTIRNVRLAQEDPYHRTIKSTATTPSSQAAAGGTISDKPDSARMGVQGASPSTQTSKAAEESAPKIVEAELGKSPGAKELERLGRDPGTAEKKVTPLDPKPTDHVA